MTAADLSSTLHTGGIRAMLDKAAAAAAGTGGPGSSRTTALTDEVKAYITSHFQVSCNFKVKGIIIISILIETIFP